MIEVFWKGFALGFAIAAPVGPIGLLCIRKTLQFGKASGLCSGLGAAAADTLYGSLAVFGLTFLSDQLVTWGHYLKLIGGLFLLLLSYRSFRSRINPPQMRLHHMSYVKDFVGTFFLTLTNPLTVICYLAIFAALGLAENLEKISAVLLISGVFLGAACWWILLSEGVGLLRLKLSPKTLLWINRSAGIIMGAIGIWSLTTVFIDW